MEARYSSDGRPAGAGAPGGRLATLIAAGAGIFVLCAAPAALTRAQNLPPAPLPMRHAGPMAGPAQKAPSLADDFAGLNYTNEQKANIQLIEKNSKLRKESVIKDDKLSPAQRDAMLQGLDRIERGQVYKVLTPEQQAEVRKRIVARREAAAQQQQQQQQQAMQRSSAPPPR